jgi:hypothetical protein
LHKYKLADKYKIEEKIPVRILKLKKIFLIKVQKPGSKSFTIVTAASQIYFRALRQLLYIIKNKFSCSQKIIFYDLGGISLHKNMVK